MLRVRVCAALMGNTYIVQMEQSDLKTNYIQGLMLLATIFMVSCW